MSSTNGVAINVEHVNKTFKLPHEKQNSVKGLLVSMARGGKGNYETQQVLQDVTFEVKKGEFFGIVGRNGSGKSTLLKVLAGIYKASQGTITIEGKLTPFIELGVGFNPELTGRENVFLNGALLGFSRNEMLGMYDDIVTFAELERFMDQKLKNYSSGMQVRLAFSIAIQANAEILLLDEVLAVGDEAFQRKCYDYFLRLKQEKQTVILVTHDMGAVQKYCDRALMIEASKVVAIGKPREIALMYELANARNTSEADNSSVRPSNPAIKVDGLRFSNRPTNNERFNKTDDIELELDITVVKQQPVQINLYVIDKEDRYIAGINTTHQIGDYDPKKGSYTLSCKIAKGQLGKGDYSVNVGIYTLEDNPSLIDIYDTTYGVDTPHAILTDSFDDRDGVFYIDATWDTVR